MGEACPIWCPCVCHDTGGSGHDHPPGGRCPGKKAANASEVLATIGPYEVVTPRAVASARRAEQQDQP